MYVVICFGRDRDGGTVPPSLKVLSVYLITTLSGPGLAALENERAEVLSACPSTVGEKDCRTRPNR